MKNKDILLIAVAAFGAYYFMKHQNTNKGGGAPVGNDTVLPDLTVAGMGDIPHHLRYQYSHRGRRTPTHSVV